MRIISGKYRGKSITAPASLPVRPTTDFAKTGLFNMLNNLVDYENIKVLDLYSGTGNIAYEFISRGTQDITMVDINKNCIRFIEEVTAKWGLSGINICLTDVFKYLANCYIPFDLIFADPPFENTEAEKLPAVIFDHKLLNPGGLFILEHISGKKFDHHLNFWQVRKYGNVSFSFFKHTIS